MRDYSVTQMFICLHRCSCVEPSDPTNATLKYWESTNVTASEIYWEALETKVLPKLIRMRLKKQKINYSWGFNMQTIAGNIVQLKDKLKIILLI